MENGKWSVDEWRGNKLVLQSSDFTHDVALQISGDFASEEQKRLYAEEIAKRLNNWYVERALHYPQYERG